MGCLFHITDRCQIDIEFPGSTQQRDSDNLISESLLRSVAAEDGESNIAISQVQNSSLSSFLIAGETLYTRQVLYVPSTNRGLVERDRKCF
jgi:hypothetical protein